MMEDACNLLKDVIESILIAKEIIKDLFTSQCKRLFYSYHDKCFTASTGFVCQRRDERVLVSGAEHIVTLVICTLTVDCNI